MVLLTFTLNSSNCTDIITYSRFRYIFAQGGIQLNDNARICVTQIVLPYSWFNVSSYNNNNSFSYIWLGTTYTISLSNAYFEVSDLNNYLQQIMINNNHYLYDSSTGDNVYYIKIETNTTYYANTITCYPIPTSLPSNYTNPSGSFPFASTTQTPQIVIGTNNFGSLTGFTSGTYPPSVQTLTYSINSNTIPNITPVNSIVIRTSLVDNKTSYVADILDTFYINDTTFGSNINYVPSYRKWLTCNKGAYHHFDIYFNDQNYDTIYMNDNNTLISIQIDNPDVMYKEIINNTSKLKSLELKDDD